MVSDGQVRYLCNLSNRLLFCRAEITVCEPDQRVQVEAPSATPNDPLYAQQWNLKAINMPKAWAMGQYGDPQKRVSTYFPPFYPQYVTVSHSSAESDILTLRNAQHGGHQTLHKNAVSFGHASVISIWCMRSCRSGCAWWTLV